MTQIAFPPPGYVQTDSLVEGIEIYAPADETAQRPEQVSFKCPNCGATTAFDVSTQKLSCEHCGYTEETHIQQVGRAAEQFEFKVETMQRAEQGWGTARKEMSCKSCGAVISSPPDALSYLCPFCGSNEVIFREALRDVLRPHSLIPFKTRPQDCVEITQRWLASSWMTPVALRSAAAVGKFAPLYIPYWTFSACSHAAWKAQVGKEVHERYYANGEWHDRTRMEWHWESGKVTNTFTDYLVPGAARLNVSTLSEISGYAVADLVVYQPELLAGLQAQSADIPLDQAWDAGRQVMRERTRSSCYDRITTSHVRDFQMSLDFSDETWRYILVPLYTSGYTYDQKHYQILLNGQNGKVAGPRPVDWKKVTWVMVGLFAPGVLLGLIGLLLMMTQNDVTVGGFALFLLVIGAVISLFIFFAAQRMEKAGGGA